MFARIRAARETRGWSQQRLADRAGVSRQLIGSIEGGRHQPSVEAALQIARALDSSVEELFADAPAATAAPVLGEAIADRVPVRTGRVGERLVAIPAARLATNNERWTAADGVTDAGAITWLPDAAPSDLVIAGCDPLLGLLGDLVADRSGHRILVVHASTQRSIAALAAGTVHGIVVHGPPGTLDDRHQPVQRWHLARWQVGLASPPRRAAASIDEICDRKLRVVQRDSTASAQGALARALRAAGRDASLPGPVAEGHIDAARRVATARSAVAGLTIEAAARAFDLEFSPLETHDVELWIGREWGGLPAAVALVELLEARSFRERAALLDGYHLEDSGASR